MKKYIVSLGVLTLVLVLAGPVFAKQEKCTTIQSGELLASDGSTIETGYDDWGYNYQAHMFNGFYCDSYRDADWCQPYKDIELMMKWNDAWLSNKDCDEDNLLDRHYGFTTYKGSGAWLTNHQKGTYDEDSIADTVNFGNEESETGHNLDGWSNIWDWGGNYGGGDGGEFRLLMGPGDGCGEDYESANFTLNTNGAVADKLILRHLDGSQDDNFDAYLWNGSEYESIGSYESQGGGENWVTTEFIFAPQSGELKFKLVATGVVTSWCSTYGQVAFNWAEIESTRECKWNYFVKIVAVPADASAADGTWYAADGSEIGPVIWGQFAVTQEVENDACADIGGLIYKGDHPGLGYFKP